MTKVFSYFRASFRLVVAALVIAMHSTYGSPCCCGTFARDGSDGDLLHPLEIRAHAKPPTELYGICSQERTEPARRLWLTF